MSSPATLSIDAFKALPTGRGVGPDGAPLRPSVVVDLTSLGTQPDRESCSAVAAAMIATDSIVIGIAAADQLSSLHVREVAAASTLTLVPGDCEALEKLGALDRHAPFVTVVDVEVAVSTLLAGIERSPRAAMMIDDLLRSTRWIDHRSALAMEASYYSMLLSGPEFAAWRVSRERRPDPGPTEPAVLVHRDEDTLTVTLNRPERRNAFSKWVRDAAYDALDIALLDPSITAVRLNGAGAGFCSGGDLDEFGEATDVVAAYLIRMERSVGWRLHQLKDRVTAELHGACIGAGIELPAFAGWVTARDGTWFQLPEVGMGLIPGAGGTVSLPRRIGQWRTGWLALSGERIELDIALAWGLVDEHVD